MVNNLGQITKASHCITILKFTASLTCFVQETNHWRTIAWSASELWSSVTVGLEVSREATKKHKELLSAWLLRARKRPLSITIAIHEEHDPRWEDPPADYSVLSLLLAHSGQWRSTDIDIPSTLLHLLPDWFNAPILERLTLRCDLEGYSDFPVIVHAPRLHSVTLVGLYQMHPVMLPWDQVKALHLEGHGVQDYLDTLKQCSSLVDLVLNEQGCRRRESTTTPFTVVKLNSLKSLRVNVHGENCLMLDRLSTPHLEDRRKTGDGRTMEGGQRDGALCFIFWGGYAVDFG